MGREPLLKRPCGLQPFRDASQRSHSVLIPVSRSYSQLEGRSLTRSSPLRHSGIATGVRLACLIHAASVRSEPGSNSPYKIPFVTDLSLSVLFSLCFEPVSQPVLLVKTPGSLLLPVNLTRAIRTIQFFKEHRNFSKSRFSIFNHSDQAEQRVLNLARFFVLSSTVLSFFRFFFEPRSFPLSADFPERRPETLVSDQKRKFSTQPYNLKDHRQF